MSRGDIVSSFSQQDKVSKGGGDIFDSVEQKNL